MDINTVTEFLEDNKDLIDKSDWKGLFGKARKISGLSGHLYFVLGQAGIEPFPNTLYGLQHKNNSWGYYGGPEIISFLTPKNGVFGITEVRANMMSNKSAVNFKSLSDCVNFAINYKGDIQEAADYLSVIKKADSDLSGYKDVKTPYGNACITNSGYLELNKTELVKNSKSLIDDTMKLIRNYAYNNNILVNQFSGIITNDYYQNKKPQVKKEQRVITNSTGDKYVKIAVDVNNRSKNNPFEYEYGNIHVDTPEGGYSYQGWTAKKLDQSKHNGDYWIEGDEAIANINSELITELTNRGFTIDNNRNETFIQIIPFWTYPKADAKNAAGIKGFSIDDFEEKEVGTGIRLHLTFTKKL